MKSKAANARFLFAFLLVCGASNVACAQVAPSLRPRVIVSTDIGGSDPDDFQSMIHYLMYADRFDTEGLIASPWGDGRKSDILRMIDLYERDFPRLSAHSLAFPTAEYLRSVTRQGAVDRAPGKGWSQPTEGSELIVECARRDDPRPLWILVWGCLDDLAQALHDDPAIAPRLRVYFIAGPNKKWSADAYQYVVSHFPVLWMIEANATYRGWFVGGNQEDDLGNDAFFERHIRGRGALASDFKNHYGGSIKMGDTPSVAYLLDGNPEDPAGPSWGGSFVPMRHSPRRVFDRPTTEVDRIPEFALIEWVIDGPDRGPASDRFCLLLKIQGQQFEGFYEGDGRYRARFVPKSASRWRYTIDAPDEALDKVIGDLSGAFVSESPWPGEPVAGDIEGLTHWWTDDPDTAMSEGAHQGARTVSRWREAFLRDWATRLDWLREE